MVRWPVTSKILSGPAHFKSCWSDLLFKVLDCPFSHLIHIVDLDLHIEIHIQIPGPAKVWEDQQILKLAGPDDQHQICN